MAAPRPFIERFFQEYERGTNTFEPGLVTSQFAEVFIGAGPNGVVAGSNDEEFRAVIPQRKAFMEQIGFKQAEILSLDESVIDEHYTMVAVQWRMTFEKEPGQPLPAEFEIVYFLFIEEELPKIVLYIAHDDEEETMRQMGLLPDGDQRKMH